MQKSKPSAKTVSLTNDVIDGVHLDFDFTAGRMTQEIWQSKYRWDQEEKFEDTAIRTVTGVFDKDTSPAGYTALQDAITYMRLGLLMPAGRIMAGAGTTKVVTLLNCFVNGVIEDNMKSITDHCSYMVLTMQQGGGMGTDFSPIRPTGAVLTRTGAGSKASGPIPFIESFDAWGRTVQSAGDRRGAQMWTISDWHPDVPKFVVAKRTAGTLTQGNMSILVSDAFMEAVELDEDWLLYFNKEPTYAREQSLVDLDFWDDEDEELKYVYSTWKARDLWKLITENTYEYSEPGIIFIDRVNQLNNLHYCEDIRCTNPCGEQPLPPHNACDLGHVVLSRMVRDPFTPHAAFDYDILRAVTRVLIRFLDNVWDVTNYPLEQQRAECLSKRRTGLGFTGLADVFAMMGYRYGTAKSADMAERITQVMCETAYDESVNLAIEKGPFPLFDADQYLAPNTFAGSRLPSDLQARIRKHGIRNSVLLTLAPTGTSSIVFGNPQGGLEPFFSLEQKRKVLQPDNSFKSYVERPYAVALWYKLFGSEATSPDGKVEYPSYFNTMKDLTVHDHILIQSRCQRWIDASISKTTNIPKEMSYDEFVKVYDLAYTSGCKGCTTYRPSAVRGSILEDASAAPDSSGQQDAKAANSAVGADALHVEEGLVERPDVLHGATYKIKWPRRQSSLYLTINSSDNGLPFEIFLTSKDGSFSEWTTALSLMMTGIYRGSKGNDVSFVAQELQQIQSVNDTAFMFDYKLQRNRNFGSLPAYIGHVIEHHMNMQAEQLSLPVFTSLEPLVMPVTVTSSTVNTVDTNTNTTGEQCPQCGEFTLLREEGCKKCTSCSYSQC